MNRDDKEKLAMAGMGLVKRIIYRRAMNGGKFAKKLVRTFDIKPESLEEIAKDMEDTIRESRKRS